MRHNLRSDVVRVLYGKQMTISEIRSAIIILRISEMRIGLTRKKLRFLLPRKRQIKRRLHLLQKIEPSRIAQYGKKYRLTDRGLGTYIWYMEQLNDPKPVG